MPGKGHLVQADETFTYSDGQSQNQAANSQIVRNLMSSPTGHQVGKGKSFSPGVLSQGHQG